MRATRLLFILSSRCLLPVPLSGSAFLGIAFLSPVPALADVVVLSDRQEIKGVVTEEGDRVTVRLDFGTVSFARTEVAEIRRENTMLHEFEQRRARLDPNDVAGRQALARWAEQNGLVESARELYKEVVALRPDDAIARERLGYRKHEGRWLSEDEYLAATGFVRYGGRWVSKEEAERLDQESQERRARRDEERIQKLEAQLALQKEQLEELESRPEPEQQINYLSSDYISNGWWLPHHPAFAYRQFLGFPHQPFVPQPQPQAGLRGNLHSRRGNVSVNMGVRPAPVPR